MRAHILSIGDELLGGFISDTNSTYLEQQLALLNIEVIMVTHVGDNRDRIADVIARALEDASLVICTGGVGPTEDDLTREAIAQVIGEEPAVDPALLELIRGFFASRGLEMPERNAKQAWTIPSGESLPNPVGTAPGWLVRVGGKVIVAMPGVPREMIRMWTEQALPRIAGESSERVIRSTTIKTIGIGESLAEQVMHDLIVRADPIVATYAKDDGVHVRVTATARTPPEAETLRDATAADVRRRLRRFVYAEDDTSLACLIGRLLAERGLTLGVVEQGTSGRIGALLLDTSATAGAVLGALALPTTPDAPAPSPSRLADQARDQFGAALGLGATVETRQGEDGSSASTVSIALSGAHAQEESAPFRMPLAETQRRAALTAADLLRRALMAGS